MPVLDALQRLVRPPNVERMIALMRRSAPLWLAQMPWLLSEADAAALRQSLQGIRAERMPRELAALIETLTADSPWCWCSRTCTGAIQRPWIC